MIGEERWREGKEVNEKGGGEGKDKKKSTNSKKKGGRGKKNLKSGEKKNRGGNRENDRWYASLKRKKKPPPATQFPVVVFSFVSFFLRMHLVFALYVSSHMFCCIDNILSRDGFCVHKVT